MSANFHDHPDYAGSLTTNFSEKAPLHFAPDYIPDPSLRTPFSRSKVDSRCLLFSHCRFVLRLISLLCSGGILGGIGNAYATYNRTKGYRLIYNGRDIWPDPLDTMPTDLLLGVGAVTAFFSLSVLIAGVFWSKIRHVSKVGNILSTIVAVIGIAISVVGVVYLHFYKPPHADTPAFNSWVCNNDKIDLPEVKFSMLCSEMKFSFTMGFAIAGTEMLILANTILGWIYLARYHRNQKRAAIMASLP
ncbi:hypothetical protein RUND412_008278 [Rhizina undulata]